MIAWLGDWLREIILVILLATFIDLILPNSVMQKYVKMVIGLFILMTILSPIISLLGTELNLNKLGDFTELPKQAYANDQPLIVEPAMQSIQAIMEEGTKVKLVNEQQSLRYVESHLQLKVQESIEQVLQLTVEGVVLNAIQDSEGEPQIESVRITLNDSTPADQASSTIVPFEPVNIDLNVDDEVERLGEPMDEQRGIHPPAENRAGLREENKNQVAKFIELQWGIPSSRIKVMFIEEVRK